MKINKVEAWHNSCLQLNTKSCIIFECMISHTFDQFQLEYSSHDLVECKKLHDHA